MTLIELIEARRNLRYRCKELFTDEKIAEQIYKYLCEGLDECEDKKHAYFFQGWAWNNYNTTQHTECEVNLYTETELRFVLDECIEDEELIEKILQTMAEVEE